MNETISKKYLEKIDKIEKQFRKNGNVCDNEVYHIKYDCVLEELLEELGYTEIVEKYEKASNNFWYR